MYSNSRKNISYPIASLDDQIKMLKTFYPQILGSQLCVQRFDKGSLYSVGFYLSDNGKILVKDTFSYIISLLKKNYKLWINPSIFSDNYDLKLVKTPKKPFFIYSFQFNEKFLGKSAKEVQCIRTKSEYYGGLEILQLFILNPGFYEYFTKKLGYAYILSNTYLINKINTLDNCRCLCIYSVGGFLVIDRVSIDYQVPWNNSLLLNPIYIQ